MKLRITHFPQVPCKPFIVEVDSLSKARDVMNLLADYDLFQYKNEIKPDYCNATFLEEYCEADDMWYSWCDSETGISDINEYYKNIEVFKDYVNKRFGNGGDNNNNNNE